MAAESLNPAIAPTTHAAPKLGKSMRHIIGLSAGSRKSPRSQGIAGFAVTTASLPPRIFGGELMPALTVRPRLASNAGFTSALADLLQIGSALWTKRLFDTLTARNPQIERVAVHPTNATPFGQGVRLSVSGEIATHTPVIHLNAAGSPTAIFRFVITVIVDAVERHFRPRLAHVGKEVIETLPALTNGNAAPSVFVEMRVVRVPASLRHPHPNRVRSRAAFAVRDPDHVRSISDYMNGGNSAI